MDQLLEKLAISKAIMDKHNQIKRGSTPDQSININKPELEDFSAPAINYNIPQEFLSESDLPITHKKTTNQPISKDSILNSKLPDEIKKLMIENPIAQSNPMINSTTVLSDELVEKATKLMGTNKTEYQPVTKINTTESKPNNSDLRKMIKEVVKEVLKESGLISESISKTNETLSLRVGQHIFEGKVTKIKKLS